MLYPKLFETKWRTLSSRVSTYCRRVPEKRDPAGTETMSIYYRPF